MVPLEKIFDLSINIKKSRLTCMVTTNVNSGDCGGLKWYLANIAAMVLWKGCGNHKLALSFKHLLQCYEIILETNNWVSG